MIQKYVNKFIENKPAVLDKIRSQHWHEYEDLVKLVIENVGGGYREPDPERIHWINDGDYQGTLVFIIAETGYQPHDYWFVKVSYGSCSGCDTLQEIKDRFPYGREPTEDQVDDYWTLALHIAQGLTAMA